jgi:hypothetical protein
MSSCLVLTPWLGALDRRTCCTSTFSTYLLCVVIGTQLVQFALSRRHTVRHHVLPASRRSN